MTAHLDSSILPPSLEVVTNIETHYQIRNPFLAQFKIAHKFSTRSQSQFRLMSPK